MTDKLKFLLNKAIEEKDAIKTIYNEVLDYTDPFAVIKDEGKEKIGTQRNIDSDILNSIDTLVSYIMSSVLSRKDNWASVDVDEIALRDKGLTDDKIDEIRESLSSDSEDVFNYIKDSNYYSEITKAMDSYVRLGTGCYAIRQTGVISKPIMYEYVSLDNLFILNDSFSRPNIVFKKHAEVSPEYIRDLFGEECKLPEGNSEDYETSLTVYEYCLPRYDEVNAITIYEYGVATEDMSEILMAKELTYNPFVVWRWKTVGGTSWGTSLVLEQLDLLKDLKNFREIYQTQARKIANPPSVFYGNQELFQSLSMDEGMMNYAGDPSMGMGQASLQTLMTNSSLMPLDTVINDLRVKFRNALMVTNIGMNAIDTKYNTAEAIRITHELFRQRFANTYEMINSELIEPTFMNPFKIMLNMGILRTTQDVLTVAQIKYVNELTKSSNINAVNNLLQYAGSVNQLQQLNQMGVALDMPKVVAYVSDKYNIPNGMTPTENELNQIKEQQMAMQQQLMQQQMMMGGGEQGATNEQPL